MSSLDYPNPPFPSQEGVVLLFFFFFFLFFFLIISILGVMPFKTRIGLSLWFQLCKKIS